MERVGEGEGKMERYCSTGQSPQRAVAPTEEEDSDPRSGRCDDAAARCDKQQG